MQPERMILKSAAWTALINLSFRTDNMADCNKVEKYMQVA